MSNLVKEFKNFIAKGNYGHSQIGNFVSVKNYIFIHCSYSHH